MVLADAGEAVRPRDPADAEGQNAREQQQPCDREHRRRAATPRTRGRRRPPKRATRGRAPGPAPGSLRGGDETRPARPRSARPARTAPRGRRSAPGLAAGAIERQHPLLRSRSRSGCSSISASTSPITSPSRPASRSASIAASAARTRSSSSRRIAAAANGSSATSASGSPCQSARRRGRDPGRAGARTRPVDRTVGQPRFQKPRRAHDGARHHRRAAGAAATRRTAPSSVRWPALLSHKPSARRSTDTVRPTWSASIASTARCFGAPVARSGARRGAPRSVQGGADTCLGGVMAPRQADPHSRSRRA